MTDNEIMKALKCCNKHNTCNGCPLITEKSCESKLSVAIIDLINRQKAEIEALINGQETLQKYITKTKSEAIKEFAERLKEKAYLTGAVSITQELVVDVRDIDDLVEEMTVNYESSKQRKEDENAVGQRSVEKC